MNAQHRIPLIPASLAANGMQGAGASDGQAAGGFEHTPASAYALLRLGVSFALKGCDALARLIDNPAPRTLEACDCIADPARHLDLSAGFSDMEKTCAREGET